MCGNIFMTTLKIQWVTGSTVAVSNKMEEAIKDTACHQSGGGLFLRY